MKYHTKVRLCASIIAIEIVVIVLLLGVIIGEANKTTADTSRTEASASNDNSSTKVAHEVMTEMSHNESSTITDSPADPKESHAFKQLTSGKETADDSIPLPVIAGAVVLFVVLANADWSYHCQKVVKALRYLCSDDESEISATGSEELKANAGETVEAAPAESGPPDSIFRPEAEFREVNLNGKKIPTPLRCDTSAEYTKFMSEVDSSSELWQLCLPRNLPHWAIVMTGQEFRLVPPDDYPNIQGLLNALQITKEKLEAWRDGDQMSYGDIMLIYACANAAGLIDPKMQLLITSPNIAPVDRAVLEGLCGKLYSYTE